MALMSVHNRLANGQSEPGAFIGLGIMEALEGRENTFYIFGFDANPIICNTDVCKLLLGTRTNGDRRSMFGARLLVFNGIGDEVGK